MKNSPRRTSHPTTDVHNGHNRHKPCKYRKRETRDGVTLDWCYAIGCCEVGDMPCEYCNEKDWGKDNGKEKAGKDDKGSQA